jgi:hypothetical protein
LNFGDANNSERGGMSAEAACPFELTATCCEKGHYDTNARSTSWFGFVATVSPSDSTLE